MRMVKGVLCMVVAGLLATPGVAATQAAPAPNVVTEWSRLVQPTIHSAAEPRSQASSIVLHTIIQLAIYDAVMATEGGFEPFQTKLDAPDGADVRAAVATAAYRSARGRVAATQHAYLDEKYDAFMAAIPNSKAKTDGVAAGEAAAAGLLAARQNDNFSKIVPYSCSADPVPAGEFAPEGGCGTEPIDAKLAQVVPLTYTDPAQFRPPGPPPLTSEKWAQDFEEVKTLGQKDSTVRTPDQTDVAYFWAEHAYVYWLRNLTDIATARNLNVRETARFLAMTFASATDASIAGFAGKYHYRAWRPRTAIPGADADGNAATAPDAAWTPLLSVNHPEYPSGHSFIVGAITEAMKAFFGTDQVQVSLTASKSAVPQIVKETRTYRNLAEINSEVTNARIWGGLHYRHSMDDGRAMGEAVARHVLAAEFRPVAPPAVEDGTLPRTGATLAVPLAATGLGLLATGTVLANARRRRRG
jgi:vanadium-dependent haloperoxidase-like protein